MAKNSGKPIPPGRSTRQYESNGVSYVPIGAVSLAEASCWKISRNTIWIHKRLEYHPGIAWVLFTGGKKFGKTHPTWLTPTVRRIQRCIICPDRCCFQRGVREQRLTEILLHRYTRVSPSLCLGFYSKMAKNSGKRITPVSSTYWYESNGVSYVAIGAVS